LFSETAAFYDLIYGKFKDFRKEAEQVAGLLKDVAPGARDLLDLGCGTGRHAATLQREYGYEIDGIDLEPTFVDLARERCPQGRFQVGDMADFDMGRSYDAVICLFSSIGYVKTGERLASTARAIFRHLVPGGVALIEPWFTPDTYTPGRIYLTMVETEELTVTRMSWSRVEAGISILDFQYLVGTEKGIRHLQETHELALFTQGEMEGGLEASGLDLVRYQEGGLTDRGLYVVRRPQAGTHEGA